LILFTGGSSYDVDVEAMEAGATLYLTKSEVNTFLLERAIRYAIERKEVEQALRLRSEELEVAHNVAENEKRRLQAVMEALPVGVAITDEKGGSIQANHAYDEVWGGTHFPAKTVADYSAYQAWWPDTGRAVAPEEWASAQAVQHEKTVVGQVLQIQRFDGTRAYVFNSASPVRDFNEQVIGSAVVIQDISQLMEAEQELATSEQRYRMLFNSLLDGFALHEIICDSDGVPIDYQFLEVNPAFEQLTGLRGDEIIGKTVLEVIPQTEAYWIETYGKVALTGESVRFENYSAALAKDYEVVAFSPKRGQFATIFTDITERKQMEMALRDNEQRYRSLFHNHHTVMLLIDPETGEIVDANPAACDFYGYSLEELTRMKITDINTLTPEQVHEEMQRAAAEQRSHFQFSHRLASSEERKVEVYSNPIQFGGRKLLYSMVYDVTDRWQKEQEIKRLALFPGENPNPVIRISLDGTLLYANRTSALLLQDWGCEAGQQVPEKWKEYIWAAAGASSPYEVETECCGRIYSFILQLINEEGYVNLYGRDITRQHRAEKELASHLANLQKLIEISIQILSERTRNGLFQRIADGARQLTGDEEIQVHPKSGDFPEGYAPLKGLLRTGLVDQDGEGIHSIMLSHKKEREFTAEDEALLIQLSALGSLSYKHIQAREEAERQTDELDAVINSMADAVLIYDDRGNMIRVNPAAIAAFGFNPLGEQRLEVVGKLSIHHSDGRPVESYELPSSQALQGQIVTNQRFTFKSIDGQETAILASSAPVWVKDRLVGAAVFGI
jgi:PAS domain S-box-containing protein